VFVYESDSRKHIKSQNFVYGAVRWGAGGQEGGGGTFFCMAENEISRRAVLDGGVFLKNVWWKVFF
jgi:hypothetical protein